MFFFPIRDHNPSGRTPWVTYALIAANVAIFLASLSMSGDPRATATLYLGYGLVPADATVLSAATSMFLHGGILHLAGNMLFLWIYGDNMEDEFGHAGFAAFYLASGVIAGYAHVLAAPGSTIPLVGASGAIAGVMGGYLLLYPKARVDVLFVIVILFRIVPVPAWLVLAFWFGTQPLSGMATPTGGGGVAYWAHAGGFLAGLALTAPLFLRRGGPAYWRRTQGHPPHPQAVYRRTDVPRAGRRRH
jgi:membrane associated rhomboid family serine protease